MPNCPHCKKALLEEVQPFFRENKKTSALSICNTCGRFSEIWFDRAGKVTMVK